MKPWFVWFVWHRHSCLCSFSPGLFFPLMYEPTPTRPIPIPRSGSGEAGEGPAPLPPRVSYETLVRMVCVAQALLPVLLLPGLVLSVNVRTHPHETHPDSA